MKASVSAIEVKMKMSERDLLASAVRTLLENSDSVEDLSETQIELLNDLLYELGQL